MATVETDSSRLLAERRAKLAKLRGEIFVQDRDITSAPALTLVDEFHETFGAADRWGDRWAEPRRAQDILCRQWSAATAGCQQSGYQPASG